MAVYKVPQDVEADDKLIGPFSFRQFIYLIIVAIACFVGYLLSKIFIGLVVVVLPVVVLFGAIALPLRKEQPMETYLVAVVRFFLKPRVRMWSPEGTLTMVTITTPTVAEQHLTKDFTADEAAEKLSYLAQVVDTKGWATRGVVDTPNNAMTDTVVAEAQATTDLFDDDNSISRSFDQMIDANDAQRKQQLLAQFQQASSAPSGSGAIFPLSSDPIDPNQPLHADPYPASMHQRVIQPPSRDSQKSTQGTPQRPVAQPQAQPQNQYPSQASTDYTAPAQQPSSPYSTAPQIQIPTSPVPAPPSPDIMRLANTKDLSISALAHEAHRLESKDSEEVVVSLR